MPGGLPDVTQRFDADTAGYVAGIARMIKENEDLLASIRKVKSEIAGLGTALAAIPDKKIKIDVDTGDALAKIGALKSALGSLGDAHAGVGILGGDNGEMVRHLRDISTYMDIATDSMGRMEEHLFRINKNVEDSSASLDMQTQMLRDNAVVAAKTADAHNSLAVAMAASAAAGRSRGGGGGAALAAAAGAAAGGGGGGGGGGGFVPWAGGGWNAVRFWGMMGAEVASTVVPAVVAAGSAALVGAQGFEQMTRRAQALYTVNEALGPSLNKTMGQYLGLGNALQQAQNAATGTVYGLGGAGLNILKSGAGGGFLQLGTNTLDMISRGVAAATLNITKAQTGTQLANLMGGGTQYLRQFGDIGANIGKTLLNVAPNLPGVGADLLSTLQFGTGALASGTGWLGQALGPFFAYEAASRWGPALLSGQGLIGRMLGLKGAGGLSGLLGKAGGGLVGAGSSDALLGTRLGGLLATGGGALGDAGLALAALTGPELGIIGGTGYLIGKGLTYQGPFAQKANALQGRIDQSSLQAAIPLALSAISQWAGVPYAAPKTGFGNAVNADLTNLFATGSALFKPQGQGWGFHPGALVTGIETGVSQFWHEATGGTPGPTDWQVAQQHIQQAGKTIVESLLGMQQISKALGVSGSQAGMIAASAGLQAGTAFDKKTGHLTDTAIQQIANYTAGIGAMSATPGAFGSNVSLMYAMGSLAGTKVSQVNAASDQLAQIVAGGPAGTAAYTTLLGAMPKGSGKAMQAFLSPQSAAAWTAFASTTQPSVISQLGQQSDWLRNAMAMGALGGGQAGGMAGFLIGGALPSAKGSPAALSMLSMYAQQFGGPSFKPGTSASAMYSGLSKWIQQGGMAAGGFNQAMTLSTEHMANLGLDANNFISQTGQGAAGGALAAGVQQYAGNLIANFMKVAGHTGSTAALGNLANFMAGSKIPLAGAQSIVQAALQMKGTSPADISSMLGQLKKQYDIYIKTHVEPPKPPKVPPQTLQWKSVLDPPKVPPAPKGGTVHYPSKVDTPTAPPAPPGGTVVYHAVVVGMPGVTAGIPAGVRAPGLQTGGLVPGTGRGDIIPAMLEPGEAIVPRNLVPMIASFLAAHGVPGFGGVPQSSASHFAAGGIAGGRPWLPYWEYMAKKHGWVPGPSSGGTGGGPGGMSQNALLTSYANALGIPPSALGASASQFAISLTGQIAQAVKNTAGAKSIASALVSKITQEVAFAKGVSGAAMQGQGYGTSSGIFGGMNVTPGTGGGTAFEQLQSYVGSVQSFTKDLGALSKQGLNKGIISQLIAAGPVQGGAVAGSILGDYGGVRGVNQLWAQLGQASRQLGAQAAMSMYGGRLSPDLKSGGATVNNVSINVSAGGGGTLSLSQADIKTLVAQVQAELLKLARRNPKTGLQLAGKGT